MAPCRLHKKRTVLLFSVAVLSLLSACNGADEEAGSAGPTPTPAATPTPTPTPAVEVTVNRAAYRVGERVRYSISNHGDRPVYYREGSCTWPFIVRFEDGNEVQLAINITEEEIPTGQLAASETLSCKWNQRAYSGEGVDFGNHQVPPGQYQVKLPYAFEEEHIHSRVLSMIAESQIFTIE